MPERDRKRKLRITLHMYCGISNPIWTVTEDHPSFKAICEKIADVTPSKLPTRLGYRGFEIVHVAVDKIPNSPLVVTSFPELEHLILSTAPAITVDPAVAELVKKAVDEQASLDIASRSKDDVISGYGYLPEYDPDSWNSDTNKEKLLKNSCYNYANDIVTDTFAVPGRKHHRPVPEPQTGAGWRMNAIADGLEFVYSDVTNPHDIPNCSENLVCLFFWPIGSYYVNHVLEERSEDVVRTCSYVVRIGRCAVESCMTWTSTSSLRPKDKYDYHWYRMDQGGSWSHKLGASYVSDHDNKDHPIRNPRLCDRGPYTEFVAYMSTAKNRVDIE